MPQWTYLPDCDKLKRAELDELEQDRYIEPAAQSFALRGDNYLEDRVKVESKSAAFVLEGCQIIESSIQLYHVAEHLESLKNYLAQYPDDFFIVVQRIVPGPPYRNVMAVARRVLPKGEDPAFDRAFDEFLAGDAEARDKVFKYVCNMQGAPWIVKKVVDGVGGQRPVIMGNGYLAQRHFSGPNYVEINVDVSSSMVARTICSAVLSYSNRFEHHECFLLEGQTKETLPERTLFTLGFRNAAIDVVSVPITEADEERFKVEKQNEQST